MEFYFQNSFLKINPYLRKFLRIVKDAFNLVIFLLGILFLFSKILLFQGIGFFIILFFLTLFLKRPFKEDIRYGFHFSQKLNLDDFLEKKVKKFLVDVLTKAEILKPDYFNLYLFKELLKRKEIKNIFFRLNLDVAKIDLKISFNSQEKIDYQQQLIDLLISAFDFAKELSLSSINFFVILGALRNISDHQLEEIFDKLNLKKEYLLSAILLEIFKKRIFDLENIDKPLVVYQKKVSDRALLNKALTSKESPILNRYGVDLTYLANKYNLGFLVGHKKEIELLIDNLKQRNNVLIIGEEGTGKETLILHLAWLIQNELVPKELLDYRVVKLDLSLVYSYSPEKFLETLSSIIKDVFESGYIILYFPYLEQIILEKNINIFQPLGEVLRSKQIPIIATMTKAGYERSLTKFDFQPLFEEITVQELSEDEAIFLLTLKSILWERKTKIIITPQAISTAVRLAKKFIKNLPLPNSAEVILKEGLNLAEKNRGKCLDERVINEIVFEKTKIPVKEIEIDEKEKLLNLENLLHQRIVNQDQAIREIARVLRIYRAGLEKKKGPIGAFLFVGPTGVGKTETAKALAKIYYGSEKSMVRLDMVEFQKSEDLDKLIGSSDGQILGRLTEPIRHNPYSLILLDEFEKTHPTILKIFLPIFDEGLIKDALGREVDFTNSLIICTSNAYSEFIKESLEKNINFDKMTEELKSKLSEVFSIELLNRFDNIIVYKPLTEDELLKIAEIMIDDLKAEVLLKQGFDLEVNLPALKEIVRLGVDPIFGARPLQRKINEIIKSELANLILANKLSRGNRVLIDFDGEFRFRIER